MKKKTSKLAIASFGLAAVVPFFLMDGLVMGPDFIGVLFLGSLILASFIGVFALIKVRKSKGALGGTGLVIVGWLIIPIILFIPSIGGMLVKANALRVGDSGKDIVVSIISANCEREAKGLSKVWPGIASDFSGVQKDYTQAPDSETYFADLMDAGVLPESSWYLFAGAGVPAATNRASFSMGNCNAWNVVAGLDENAPDNTPFMFTRNLDITELDLRDDSIDLGSKMDCTMKPFGDIQIVYITKGGVARRLRQKDLRSDRRLFLGGAVFNDEINRNAKVLKAKGND